MKRFGLMLLALLLVACGDSLRDEGALPAGNYVFDYNTKQKMEARGFRWGSPVFVRIFKEEALLEVWIKGEGERFELFQQYPICTFSGDLGPKKRQGDKQSPEGFYAFSSRHLNPNSQYHLSFNLNYPNAYDRAHGYTGDYLMVHGECVSVGCYAMGNRQIEEIYTLVSSALQHGQPFVRVHAFPFRLTQENLEKHRRHPASSFWQMLRPGYDIFERTHIPPEVDVVGKRYVVRP
ncbi:murein L,D-transpeptidase [Suttonella sp. R2A3]|uniref:L,D-transpeptidase family protein n=1 Tax=Suttonella sp. R2A3 TaxID=2908648 RepID=UPI001F15B5A4|nr:murein L,D-transpeptidase family protein [Suttonella sp. R2A3]UJF25336.1 murein L,D-transpeptidase [Suttonella sp. R2A3]